VMYCQLFIGESALGIPYGKLKRGRTRGNLRIVQRTWFMAPA
jgi:hypothetical protein